MCQAGKIKKQKNFLHLDTGKKRAILKHTHKKGVKSGDSRNDQARPSAVALRAMAGQVGSGATSRPSGVRSRRWITPGYDPGRVSFFLVFTPPLRRKERRSRNDQAATTERRDTSPLRRKERRGSDVANAALFATSLSPECAALRRHVRCADVSPL